LSFDAGAVLRMMSNDDVIGSVSSDDAGLILRAARLHELVKIRDCHFRRSVMADSSMSIMLSLLLGELKSVELTPGTLSLVNMLDDDQADGILEALVHAGLAQITGRDVDRQTVGLTALGSARMRSFVSDYSQI
jgi:hypothetical protein